MSWTWRYEDARGVVLDRPKPEAFPSQSDAESWLGEHWRNLQAQGVYQVVLLDESSVVYGPMGLEPA
ncbi:MAG TPA: hypothetical protein VLJ59_08640 [Mycobacteriales bacterium]|nr:hypothetical protein [Mycobacteriales bacterium]